MTKYEWEKELKKYISALPKDEQAKIFDYYGEIFEDKIEAGMREEEIVYEFGNPCDAARKILSDYRAENTEPVSSPRRPEKESGNGGFERKHGAAKPQSGERQSAANGRFARFLLMFLLYLLLGIPALAVFISLAAVGLALAISCIALIAGGGAYAVYWIVQLFATSFAAHSAVLTGLGLFAAGLGFTFVVPCFKLTKYIWIGFGKILKATFLYIRGKKAVTV